MTGVTEGRTISRIIVALDASRHSLRALDAAAAMATVTSAELCGVFVEDAELLQLARIPLVREVGGLSASRRTLSSPVIERSLRAVGAEARRALALAAERRQVRYSFHVARGLVIEELIAAARDADLVALGKRGHGLPAHPSRLGSTARTFLTHGTRAVLLSPRGRASPGDIVVAVPASLQAIETLVAAAGRLARALERHLLVLSEEGAAGGVKAAGEYLRSLGGPLARYQRVPSLDLAILRGVVTTQRAAALVLGQAFLDEGPAFEQLVESLDCSVLLVR